MTSSLTCLSTAMPLDGRCKNGHLHFCNTTFFSTSWCWSLWCGCALCSSGRGRATPPLCIRRHRSPQAHGPSVIMSPHPLRASRKSRTATPVSTPVPPTQRHPAPRHRVSCPREDAAARWIPPRISAPTQPVPIGAGSAGAISGPMAIRVVVPGGNCCASPVAALFSRPSARSCMVSAPLSSSSCASSRAWPRV
jgi:hypothetical protein